MCKIFFDMDFFGALRLVKQRFAIFLMDHKPFLAMNHKSNVLWVSEMKFMNAEYNPSFRFQVGV